MICESYIQSNLVIFSLQTDSLRPWPWMESVWRKRKAFTFHRIHWMCHCIEIQANQWTQILATFLMLRVWVHPWCIQKLWIQTLWKLNDWTFALRLQIHGNLSERNSLYYCQWNLPCLMLFNWQSSQRNTTVLNTLFRYYFTSTGKRLYSCHAYKTIKNALMIYLPLNSIQLHTFNSVSSFLV